MNKKIIIVISTIVALIIGVCAGMYMKPATETPIDIAKDISAESGKVGFLMAVIDDQKIMNEGKVYVSLKKDYESKIADLKDEADEAKAELKDENDRIAAMRATATQEEFNEEVQKFAAKQKSSSERIAKKIKDLEAAYVEAINKIKSENIDKILADLAKEQKLSVITSRMTTLYYAPALDVTETVLFRLNKKISKAKLDI